MSNKSNSVCWWWLDQQSWPWNWSSWLIFHIWRRSWSFLLLFHFLSINNRLSRFIISKICDDCWTNFLLNFLSILILKIVEFFLRSLVDLIPILLIINLVFTLLSWQLTLFLITLILLRFLNVVILDFIPLILSIVTILLCWCDLFLLNLNFLCNNFFNFKRNIRYFNLKSTISKCFLVSLK